MGEYRRASRFSVVAAIAVTMLLIAMPLRVRGASDGITSISAGGQHACALHADRTVSCWGNDRSGQLGDGTTGDPTSHLRLTPVKVQQGGSDMADVKAISAGDAHTCVLKIDGTVWCWGSAFFGQMGNGTKGDGHKQLTPVQVQESGGDLTGITAISAGLAHTCARRDDGSAWCWGADDRGQIGDGTTGDSDGVRLVAVQVRRDGGFLTKVTGVSAGEEHSCARRGDGTAWCWGDDALGELGDGTFGDPVHGVRLKAVKVRQGSGFLTHVAAVTAGVAFSCARKTDESAWCWGDENTGRLGDGSASGERRKAVQVRRGSGFLTGVTAIDAGASHACVRRGDATAWCWGDDQDGGLGDGTTGNAQHFRAKAVEVIHGSNAFGNIAKINAGSYFTCGIRQDTNAWCWGRNSAGQLGTGTADSSAHSEPERVRFP
jgi:alpha-tubulin suppressor-like RCC1 family protein